MENMRLVINYDYVLNRHHAKIYYHDKVNNVARLMVDHIALLSLKGSNDLVQEEVVETEKKIQDPEFTMFQFQAQASNSFRYGSFTPNKQPDFRGGSDYKSMESRDVHIGAMEHDLGRGEPEVIIQDEDGHTN